MTFHQAAQKCPLPVCNAILPGKKALEARHRQQVNCREPERLTSSINLDQTLQQVPNHRNSNRWDYGVGYKPEQGPERAVWIEVHPASTSEVGAVLRKLDWLKRWLESEARALQQITITDRQLKAYHWLATETGVHIRPGTPQDRRLRAAGLDSPRRKILLP